MLSYTQGCCSVHDRDELLSLRLATKAFAMIQRIHLADEGYYGMTPARFRFQLLAITACIRLCPALSHKLVPATACKS